MEKLFAGVLRVLTPLGPRYIRPSLAQRIYVRVTTGLIRENHAEVADLIADAAAAGAWTAQHR